MTNRAAPVFAHVAMAFLLATAAVACTDDSSGPGGGDPVPPAGYAWVVFEADTVVAEVADTEAERGQGLMFRTSLPPNGGMLFVWTDVAPRTFWMRNTFLPLDVAFLDASRKVINIRQMEPETETIHASDGPAMLALEVHQGWFAAHGVVPGSPAQIVFGAP